MVAGSHMRLIYVFIITGTLLKTCYEERIIEEEEAWNITGRVIEFDRVFAFCDREENFLLYPIGSDTLKAFSPLVRFGDYESISFDGKELRENRINELGQVVINHPYLLRARSDGKTERFQLYFTNLPLLHIHTHEKVRDEPKVLCWMELMEPDSKLYEGYAGIEIRGRTSADYEKKSYGLELWENWHREDISLPLLDMREGEDWILDAMYVDPLRMRNRVSFELWEKMWKDRVQTPFGISNPGMHSWYTELFINQRYMGLYCLSEKLNEDLVHLSGGQAWTGGVLYKAFHWKGGATAFTTYNSEPVNSMVWEGWEQIYPDHDYFWGPLAELRKSVVHDPDEVFGERIDSLMNLEAAAAYYLFVNLILAEDNIIKNYFLARYPETSSFLWLPWDLEGSWGITWDGTHPTSSGLVENRLYERLLELDAGGFNALLEDQWEHYRGDIFEEDSLSAAFLVYAELLRNSGAIERENQRWPDVDIDLDAELSYLLQWIPHRLEYLDQAFE